MAAGSSRVLRGAIRGAARAPQPALEHASLREQQPRLRESGVVLEVLKHANGPFGMAAETACVHQLRAREHAQVRALHGRPPLHASTARGPCPLDRLVEHAGRPAEVADLDEREAQVGQQLEPAGVVRRQEGGGTSEQARGSGHVAAAEGAAAGRREAIRRAPGQLVRVGPVTAELLPTAERLLEVVADDLGALRRGGSVRFEPVGEALVERPAEPLRDRSRRRPAG